jgi:hypothetical protein
MLTQYLFNTVHDDGWLPAPHFSGNELGKNSALHVEERIILKWFKGHYCAKVTEIYWHKLRSYDSDVTYPFLIDENLLVSCVISKC